MKRFTTLVLALALLVPACASALTGQSYATFIENYDANVTFINQNDNRHLLPLLLSARKSTQNDGRVYYDLIGDVLNVTVTTNIDDVIEECEVRLTAPAGMTYGSIVYNDFAISGYHSYAFLMAMDSNSEPAKRYELVSDVVQGMKDNNGAYTRQLGVYTLTCSREGNMAILDFQNDGVPTETPTPAPGATLAPGNQESAAPTDAQTVAPDTDTDSDAPADADGYIG